MDCEQLADREREKREGKYRLAKKREKAGFRRGTTWNMLALKETLLQRPFRFRLWSEKWFGSLGLGAAKRGESHELGRGKAAEDLLEERKHVLSSSSFLSLKPSNQLYSLLGENAEMDSLR